MAVTAEDKNAIEVAREEALQAMEVKGGKLLGEEDITYAGTKFVLPASLTLEESLQFLGERNEDEKTVTRFERTFKYRPLDGARATGKVIRERFGFTMGKTLWSFFGRTPPAFIDVEVGVHATEQVPWGAMKIPGWRETTVYLDETMDKELGLVFRIVVECPRSYRWAVQGFFDYVADELRTNSIYRGKAIDGSNKFLDTSVVNPEDVIFTASIQARLNGDVWRFIQHTDMLLKRGMSAKYAVLFEGDYGTGKTLAALLTAQIAEQNGWTFLMAQPGRDDLMEVMQMARIYQPAVVFGEDVDATASASAENIETQLDMLDGIKTKGVRLMLVLTTNHADLIHRGMLRPGRIGAVIRFGRMEPNGVERLARRVIGDELAQDTDFAKVYESMDGYSPAYVREALDRSVRYAISEDGTVGKIGTDELVFAADGLRDQYALMMGATDIATEPTFDRAMRNTMRQLVDGTQVTRHGEYFGELASAEASNGQ